MRRLRWRLRRGGRSGAVVRTALSERAAPVRGDQSPPSQAPQETAGESALSVVVSVRVALPPTRAAASAPQESSDDDPPAGGEKASEGATELIEDPGGPRDLRPTESSFPDARIDICEMSPIAPPIAPPGPSPPGVTSAGARSRRRLAGV